MALQVLANGCSVYETTGTDDEGKPTYETHVYKRGDVLPDWVDSHQAFVLVSTGMAAEVGDNPDTSIRPLNEQPAPVLLPEHSTLPVVDIGLGPVVQTGEGKAAEPKPVEGALPPLPADVAAKPVWEDFAVDKLPGDFAMERSQVESMKKAELVSEVKVRYYEAADRDAEDEGDTTLPPSFG
jgi:hypothetical protein